MDQTNNSTMDIKSNGASAQPESSNSATRNQTATRNWKTLGPVSDLERHLPSEWWRTLFNALYLKTDGDVVENSENTNSEVDTLISVTNLQPDESVLDLCCGQARHSLELARRGFKNVTGVDRSRYLIRLARKRAQQAELTVSFREGDARTLRLTPESFDCVAVMGNSFGYFDRAEDDLQVLSSIWRVLRPGGRLMLDLVDGEWTRGHFEPRSWEWIDQAHFVCRERAIASDGKRLISREVVTHAERGVIADQFYAERLYTVQQLRTILKKAGFDDIVQHEAPVTQSSRNQDLGMLAKRIIILACKPASVSPRPKRGPLFPKVTVLLGDPHLPDDVKRVGAFSQEDIDTVNKMKEAVTDLSEYNFRFWDRHEFIQEDLKHHTPDFVLNLCDEGFHNDAFKELHVPALLELHNVPYSGAGPQCLGLCYDKALVRSVAHTLDIAVPLESYFAPDDQMATLPSVFPALVKPNHGDSSVGITQAAVVHNQDEFIAYWEQLRAEFPNRPLLVQEFLSGAEYSVGIIGNVNLEFTVLPILEVDYSGLDTDLPQILGYESKWDPASPYWTQIKYREAALDDKSRRILTDASLLLFERLGCRDYARFDFRADAHGTIKLLEANPNPGWCWDGKLNIMAGYADMSYGDLLGAIIEAAQSRYLAEAYVDEIASDENRS